MPDSVPLKTFARKFACYYPYASYKKALRWAHLNILPTWPRVGQEHFNVKIQELWPFCLELGLSIEQVDKFLEELCS